MIDHHDGGLIRPMLVGIAGLTFLAIFPIVVIVLWRRQR